MVAEEEGRGGGMWCWLRRAAMEAEDGVSGGGRRWRQVRRHAVRCLRLWRRRAAGLIYRVSRNIYFIVSLRRYVGSKLIYIQYVNLREYNKFRCMYRDHLRWVRSVPGTRLYVVRMHAILEIVSGILRRNSIVRCRHEFILV